MLSSRPAAVIVLLIAASVLGLAPILVRLAETGPAAAGFWRLALAIPLLLLLAWRGGIGGFCPFSWLGALIALGGFLSLASGRRGADARTPAAPAVEGA